MTTVANTAHLTSTVPSPRPTVFEILSHEGFSKTLKPAVLHVVKVLASSRPESHFSIAFRHFDELYLAFDALVQWYYVLTRGATFSEAFYGLERRLTKSNEKLSRIRLSYFLSVILPYLSDKVEASYKGQQEKLNVPETGIYQPLLARTPQQLFVQYYPCFRTMLKAINLYYLLAYTFDRSEHPSLIFKVLKMTLGYTSEERSNFVESKKAELWDSSNWRDPKKLPKLILRSLGESIFLAVELSTFFIQFLEWWYNDEKKARMVTTSSQTPPAPHAVALEDAKLQNVVKMNQKDMNKCPICRKDINNPTVISVSGVAYCYGCIFASLKRDAKCPLTGIACNAGHLIRIYV